MTADRREGEMMDDEELERSVARIPIAGCWIWLGNVTQKGYARAMIDGRDTRVHRWMYEKTHGPVGDLVVDHLCRVRCCVNPDHLEAAPNTVNVMRGIGPTAMNSSATACKQGHVFDVTIVRGSGAIVRRCSLCIRKRMAAYRRSRRAKRRAHV